jgi:hypothetical protein
MDNERKERLARLAAQGDQILEGIIDNLAWEDLHSVEMELKDIIESSSMSERRQGLARFIFSQGMIKIEAKRSSKTGEESPYGDL